MKTFKFFALALVPALMLVTAASAVQGPIVHHVLAGGPDACVAFGFERPGCDGNFSLSAKEYADGSMSGQYTDRYANGDGFHAVIDCVSVVGNEAWVSGVITSGTVDGVDVTGLFVWTRVQDNGTSANDPPDKIGISIITFVRRSCTDHRAGFGLLEAPEGQVRVR